MKFLIVDDTPEALKPLTKALRDAGHETATARNLAIAWRHIQSQSPVDLVVIDIALDREIREFAEEQKIISNGLIARGHGALPMSRQALGLRLWRQRRALRIRYCYTSHHMYLWLPNLDPDDPEFGGGNGTDHPTIMDKSSLWQNNVASKLTAAFHEWDNKSWLAE
jgi:CheY-like chemotaxis protein